MVIVLYVLGENGDWRVYIYETENEGKQNQKFMKACEGLSEKARLWHIIKSNF